MKLKIKKMEVSVSEITNTNINKINSPRFLLTLFINKHYIITSLAILHELSILTSDI